MSDGEAIRMSSGMPHIAIEWRPTISRSREQSRVYRLTPLASSSLCVRMERIELDIEIAGRIRGDQPEERSAGEHSIFSPDLLPRLFPLPDTVLECTEPLLLT